MPLQIWVKVPMTAEQCAVEGVDTQVQCDSVIHVDSTNTHNLYSCSVRV